MTPFESHHLGGQGKHASKNVLTSIDINKTSTIQALNLIEAIWIWDALNA